MRFSSVLRALLAARNGDLRLSDILAAFGERGFGAVVLIFAGPNIAPLPPGTSTVLAIPLLIVSVQFLLRFDAVRLPRSLGARTIPRDRLDATVRRVLPSLERIERLLTPRLALMFSPVGDRATAVACLALSVLLFLPIPFTSIAPAIVLTVIAFGLLQRDGAAVLVGWIGLAGLLTAFIAMFGALMTATRAFCGTVLGG